MKIRQKYSHGQIGHVNRNHKLFIFICVAVLAFVFSPDMASAADGNTTILNAGTGLGGPFDDELKEIGNGIVKAMHVVMVMMTVIAGMQIAFGIEDGKKFIWQVMLGFGLAYSFGTFLTGTGLWDMANQAGGSQSVEFYKAKLDSSGNNWNILGNFMTAYKDQVIVPGTQNILPYCLRLLIVLTVVQATWELTMKLLSGDKMQYLISMTLKVGFYMFLMINWFDMTHALMYGFETIGLKAAGSSASAGDIIGTNIDAITALPGQIAEILFGAAQNNSIPAILATTIGGLGGPFILILALFLVIAACLFLTAIEMFMARIEFYTMALLTLPLLAFGTTDKFSFLTDKAIGAMFNLAIKCSVIAFLAILAPEFILGIFEQLKNDNKLAESVSIMMQTALASAVIFLLTKKIPNLVTGLLNGSPQLGGSSMVDMARGGATKSVQKAAEVAAAIKTAGASTAVTGGGKLAFAKAFAGGMMRNQLANTGMARSFREGLSNFQSNMDSGVLGGKTRRQLEYGQNSSGGKSGEVIKHDDNHRPPKQ